ncbi:bifunctional endo-1 4-beta-xylanase XylA-like [Prunus yedoensis var. nudiflora]|uniref:Bifunctional endo-1 4-beta-xylanase XylA-like n=1 Tax=Prunus yedoensis var. nudiflora TaxID=2094558 RepID=A0A314YD38_PRUYE|nr:bifunctional endo-1 4-beta-xylanase XylA-like [Prunus yedoensis var. nudiflora]
MESTNDSAGEEAFQNAKQHFLADINGLSCDISLPDPSIYIDEIDWYPIIDPELIKEVDHEYFAPDEEEGKGKFGRRNKNAKYSAFVPPDGHNRVPNNGRNPWECDNIKGSGDLKNTVQGRNQWNTNGDNPWESGITQGNGSMDKNAWENSRDKSWGWNQMGDNITLSKGWDNDVNPWEGGCQGVASVEVRIVGRAVLVKNNKSLKDRGWRDRGGDEWGWKQWGSQNNQKNNLDFRIVNSGLGARNEGGHKRERPHEYISGYESSRFQGSDYQTGNCWSRGNNRKRVSFARV